MTVLFLVAVAGTQTSKYRQSSLSPAGGGGVS